MYEITEVKQHRELIDLLDVAICALFDAKNLSLTQRMVNFEIHETYSDILSVFEAELLNLQKTVSINLEKWEIDSINKMKKEIIK